MNNGVVFTFAVSFMLMMSIANVSAFNFVDWIKGIFERLGITGNPVYEVSSDGLIAQYSFQQESYSGALGEVGDSAAENNDGTARGGAQIINNGINGKSLSLDGFDDYISFSDSYQGLNMSGKDMTMSVWVYRAGEGYYDRIFTRYYNAGTFGGYALGITNSNKVWFFTGNGTTGGTWDYSNGNILHGAWHHIAVTQTGSSATLYIDGIRDASWTKQKISGVAPTLTQIGGLKSAYLSFNGSIDELIIYNKTLSGSEILNLYNNQLERLNNKRKSTQINGICGSVNYSCINGNLSDVSSNTTHYLWKCLGVNSGTNTSCSSNISIFRASFGFGLNDRVITLRDSIVVNEFGEDATIIQTSNFGKINSESPVVLSNKNYWAIVFTSDKPYIPPLSGYIYERDIEKSNLKKINQSDVNSEMCYLELMIKEKKIKFNNGDYVRYFIDDLNAKEEIGVHVSPSIYSQEIKNFEIGAFGMISSGPVEADGYKWYHADFFNERGADLGDGWAIQEQLEKIYKTESNSIRKFNSGDKIFAIAETNIKRNPSDTFSGTIATIDMFEYGSIKMPSKRFFWYENIGPVFADGKVWWKVNFNGTIGWVDEDYIEEVENIEFSLENATQLYGNYSHIVKQTYEGEESTYYMELYDSRSNLLSKHPLSSSRIVFYDTFEEENPGGIIELDEGASEQIVKNSNIAKILIDYLGKKIEFSVSPENIQCERTCGKENEIIDLSKRQKCCPNSRLTTEQKGGITFCTKI